MCLLASGPKGTRDFSRSKHSRRCARLKAGGGKNKRQSYTRSDFCMSMNWQKSFSLNSSEDLGYTVFGK